jgi:exosortase
VALAALSLCLPAIRALSYLFGRIEFYAHGYLVPLVVAYLLFQSRAQIAASLRELRPPAYGAPLVLVAGVFETLAFVGDMGFAAGLGIPLVFAATAYAVGGARLLQPLALPLVFIALIVPPPRSLLYQILFRLKLLVTETAVAILHAWQVPVLAEGNRLLVPGHTLFVADACSGLTSIVTMLPIACIAAYFLSHGFWRRAVVVASVLPLAIAANVARVVVIVLLVPRLGVQVAQGWLHESFGIATYVFGTLALVGVARLLR